MSRSTSFSTFSLSAAILTLEKVIGEGRVWKTINEFQERLMRGIESRRTAIVERLQDVIESVASFDADELNDFLKRKGFSIALRPFTQPGEFGAAAVLDVDWTWSRPCKTRQVNCKGTWYPAVHMEHGYSFLQADGHDGPILCAETTGGKKVYMTIHDSLSGMDLAERTAELTTNARPASVEFKGAVFPMIDHSAEVDISDLVGMNTVGDDGAPAIVSQALMQGKLRQNEFGGRAQSGVAVAVTRGISIDEPLEINRPFLWWIVRDGIEEPLFAAHICTDSWKKPADLTTA